MSIDEAVKLQVERILLEGGYVTSKEASEIAIEIAEETKDIFSQEIKETGVELGRIRSRLERLWDQVSNPPVAISSWTRFWRTVRKRLKFWEKS